MSENNKEMTFAIFFRKIFDWEWYTDSKTFHLFFHCVLRANHEPNSYQGIPLKRGQFVTGRKKLSVETGLSEQEVRTILKRLKSTNEITIQSNHRNSIITVNNYDEYQSFYAKKRKINQQTNREITTNNNNIYNTKEYIYNTHTIEKNVCVKNNNLSSEDLKILRKYAKENGARRIKPYVAELIKNGGYLDILKEERERLEKLERQKAKEDIPPPKKIEEEVCKMTADEVREFMQSKVKSIPKRRKGEKK